MVYAILTLVALILFFNGFVVLGVYGGRQVVFINVAAGVLIATIGLTLGLTDALKALGPTQSVAAAASALTFALLYILLAGEVWAGTDFKGLGWYCFMGGVIMLLLGLGFGHVLGSTLPSVSQFAVFWLIWASLFFLFWAVWGLGKASWAKAAGYYTIFVAFFTCLYPTIAFINMGRLGW
jgi:hypothetical protein